MNIADRIQYLRKQNGYSQEELAVIRLAYQDKLYQNGKVNKAHQI